MSIAVNGESRVPPGFRFHPTEEELLNYYLRKKVACEKIDLDVIRDVDLNKLEPWDILDRCAIGSAPQNDWYFFSHKDKKYPTGTRTNRATAAGFWKATGRDKAIYTSSRRIGMRKTLVFYKGRAPHGQKSDWIMHEYRLDENEPNALVYIGETMATQEDGWVVCRVFKKKKIVDRASMNSRSDDTLDQILQYMGRSCKQENEMTANVNSNVHENSYQIRSSTETLFALPSLVDNIDGIDAVVNKNLSYKPEPELNDQWGSLEHLPCLDDSGFMFSSYQSNCGDGDLWSLTSSALEKVSYYSK